MHYMIELHYTRDQRDAAIRYFWDHGTTNYEAKVTIKDGWVATQDMVSYTLVEAKNSAAVARACKPLKEFGDVTYRRVTSFHEM